MTLNLANREIDFLYAGQPNAFSFYLNIASNYFSVLTMKPSF